MIPRITFLLIAAFWVAMNVLLWRAEYDSHGTGIRVPISLVWRKILTAPDISSLNVFQGGERTGFCEFSTSVEQEMATLDERNPMLKHLNSHAGYQFRFNGNVGLGDYTNRLTFNGQMEFSRQRVLREFNVKITTHAVTVELHSLASEQTVHLTITSEGVTNEQVFTFAELQDPAMLWSSLLGNFGEWAQELDLPMVSQFATVLPHHIQWEAHYDRLRVRTESVPTYRLETRILDRPLVIYVSTLGEILKVELPGGVVASYDQFGNP